MAFQVHNTGLKVGVPNKNFEIKATGNEDFVFLAVGDLTDSFFVAFE